eukprot:3318966-Pleurochrysis_carterae.AAC.2
MTKTTGCEAGRDRREEDRRVDDQQRQAAQMRQGAASHGHLQRERLCAVCAGGVARRLDRAVVAVAARQLDALCERRLDDLLLARLRARSRAVATRVVRRVCRAALLVGAWPHAVERATRCERLGTQLRAPARGDQPDNAREQQIRHERPAATRSRRARSVPTHRSVPSGAVAIGAVAVRGGHPDEEHAIIWDGVGGGECGHVGRLGLVRAEGGDEARVGSAAGEPAQLARGGLEDGARAQQHERGHGGAAVLFAHRARDGGRTRLERGAYDALRRREGGAAARAQRGTRALGARFDVVRVQVAPVHDEQILAPPDQVQSAGIDEAEVARAQVAALRRLCLVRALVRRLRHAVGACRHEGLLRQLRLPPVALSDAAAGDPHLAHCAVGQQCARLRVDDLDAPADERLRLQHNAPRLEHRALRLRAVCERHNRHDWPLADAELRPVEQSHRRLLGYPRYVHHVLRHAKAREPRRRVEATRRERLVEGTKRRGAHRLGAVHRGVDVAQPQLLPRRRRHLANHEGVGKVWRGRDHGVRAVQPRDGLEPAAGPL